MSQITVADIETLAWEKSGGLLPAIAQHATTGAVLMLCLLYTSPSPRDS